MLAVGKELLIGRTLDTNSHWLGSRLAKMGSMLKQITTVDDELEEISSGLKESLARSPDFVVVVGGLGPTPDDMTLRGIAMALGVRMRVNREALSLIKAHYARRGLAGIEITPARRKMAILPAGSTPVPNLVGTAPAVKLEGGRTTIFSLPGVPAEMKDIFRKSVEPEIKKKVGLLHRKYVKMKVEGVFESAIAPILSAELKKFPWVYIKTHPKGIREGILRLELDVAVVTEDDRRTREVAAKVVDDLTEAVSKQGGTVKEVRKGALRK